jgi:hypothetical protein
VRWSILIVAALVAIGIAASVDALLGEPRPGRPVEPEAPTKQTKTTQRTPTPGAAARSRRSRFRDSTVAETI